MKESREASGDTSSELLDIVGFYLYLTAVEKFWSEGARFCPPQVVSWSGRTTFVADGCRYFQLLLEEVLIY